MATEFVNSGTTTVSTATSTTYLVLAPGTLDVASGGAVSGATAVGPGSTIWVQAGGTTTNSAIVGGVQFTYGNAVGSVVSNGGIQHVYAGGTATNANIAAGGYQDVWNGTVTNTTLAGHQQILAGGVANSTVIVSGGYEYVGADGTTNGTIITASGVQYVDLGGTSGGSQINNGGFQYVVGAAHNTVVNSGGIQQVAGTAENTTVSNGAVQHVVLGGSATSTTVQAGGYLSVTSASVVDTELNGNLQVLSGGTSTATVIFAGGFEYIGAGGSSDGSMINVGGLQYVDVSGTSFNATISGGFQYIAGSADDITLNGGGRIEVASGGTIDDVDFTGSAASLILDDASGLTGTVYNFGIGDSIDLLNTSVSSYGFDGTTLTLNTGSGSYAYQFANVEAGTEFSVVSDGHGGSEISLSLLSQFSASLAPEAGADALLAQESAPADAGLIHAQT